VHNVFTEKEIAIDASLLRKWIVGFIGAFSCKMQGSVRWNRDSEDRHLRLPSHGAAKGKGIGRPPSIAKPLGRPLRTNRASVSWALNEASFPSRGAPRHRFVFEGVM
jgi:hypothetical protein